MGNDVISAAIGRLDSVPWNALSAQQRRIAAVLVQHAAVAAAAGETDRALELLDDLPLSADALQNGARRGEPSTASMTKPSAAPPLVVDLRNSLVDLLYSRP